MESPLFDHDLDDYPAAPQGAAGRGKPSGVAGRKAASKPHDPVLLLVKNYFLFVSSMALSPLLIPITALAPRSAVRRFLSRPEPGAKAGVWLGENYLRLIFLCQLGWLLIPIAALAPRALRSRFLDRWAGKSLCLYCGFFALLVTATASELLPTFVEWPYPGVACLLGLSALAADYVRRIGPASSGSGSAPRGRGPRTSPRPWSRPRVRGRDHPALAPGVRRVGDDRGDGRDDRSRGGAHQRVRTAAGR